MKPRHLEELTDFFTKVLHSDPSPYNHQKKFPAQIHREELILATPAPFGHIAKHPPVELYPV